jgi:hypothetical protein
MNEQEQKFKNYHYRIAIEVITNNYTSVTGATVYLVPHLTGDSSERRKAIGKVQAKLYETYPDGKLVSLSITIINVEILS